MRRLFSILMVLASPFLWNCSESDKPPVLDQSVPQVVILYPTALEPATVKVSDSTDVYFVAHDLDAAGQDKTPTKVELWFSRPNTSDRVLIGTAPPPITIDQVPSDIRSSIEIPAGWSLYTRKWYTGPRPLPPIGTPINSGTTVQLFALAYDAAGNAGRSPEVVRVDIFNFGDDLRRPRGSFIVTPPSGTVEDSFTFDANGTLDDIDPIHLIRVRWDFDGSPSNGWDIDWDRDARADELQTWKFAAPSNYTVVMEARNSYLSPDSVDVTRRAVAVTDIGGNPRPPEEDNYADVPSGTYVVGDSSYVMDGRTFGTDSYEMPVHLVKITTSFRIEKTEVTNRLYLNYLLMTQADSATTEYRQGVIYSRDPKDPATPQDVLFILNRSRIFFDLDHETYAVQPGFEDHPVTGVTWHGARHYAISYGLRLPTESEWEIAARGSNVDWNYPFANGVELSRTDGPSRVNYAGSRVDPQPFANTTTPRGFYNGQMYQGFQTTDSPSAFGVYDMAGNVSEWVSDYLDTYTPELQSDPQGLVGIYKVIRGGSYLSSRAGVRCTARAGQLPEESLISVGFRTAYIQRVVGK